MSDAYFFLGRGQAQVTTPGQPLGAIGKTPTQETGTLIKFGNELWAAQETMATSSSSMETGGLLAEITGLMTLPWRGKQTL